MKKYLPAIVATFFIVVFGVSWQLTKMASLGEYGEFFQEEIIHAGVERGGQPIEGFDAFIFLKLFPGLIEQDFDGVETLEGVYHFDDVELKYKRTAGQPITSAEKTISEEGYETLLTNLSKRLGIDVKSRSDITSILEKLGKIDVATSLYTNDDFSILYPEGWYPWENANSVFFTHDEHLEIPANTEGYAIGPWIQVTVDALDGLGDNASSIDQWFSRNLWVEGSEFLKSKEVVIVAGKEMTRVVTLAAGAGGEVLHYVFYDESKRVITLSQYPYVAGGQDTDDFEQVVTSFQPNFAAEGSESGSVGGSDGSDKSGDENVGVGNDTGTGTGNDGGGGQTGILPFDSGATGRVLIGPTCPVMREPPDPSCADRSYSTTVEVYAVGSYSKVPFSIVDTDKEGVYKVMLPPGDYTLRPVGGSPFPRCSETNITVTPSTLLQVDLSCDTGIR